MKIDCDFPGGNILVDSIEPGLATLRQDLRDTEGWWFYWAFRVRGGAGQMMAFKFANGDVIGSQGPAISEDGGESWRWLGAASVQRDPGEKGVAFSLTLPQSDEFRFSFCIPYQEFQLKSFLAKHGALIRVEPLCRSEQGRQVEILRLGSKEPKHRLLLTSRHHACEAMANYVVEGLLERALEDSWWGNNAEIAWVPFMDVDGVENGDQGKNRKPHDHNRDYLKERYASVAALKAWVPNWSRGRLDAALDFHCPYIRGERDRVIHFVRTRNEEQQARARAFCADLREELKASVPFDPADNEPWGEDLNLLSSGSSCQEWMEGLPGIGLASTVEFPYDLVKETPATEALARAFGRAMAGSLKRQCQLRRL